MCHANVAEQWAFTGKDRHCSRSPSEPDQGRTNHVAPYSVTGMIPAVIWLARPFDELATEPLTA